ncbi:Lrp/AsnC family transcriptional regulator, partial [candidate division KSB1 bacterium]|nr:Lrp/AsnC family transcriptional regulator [candidate division KSB1 bacterium]NIR72854.1 Lrp/AsnC family transcriptional regulator [candidate division KSB1 bacterium]NIS23753.1 Lrp/AsnC family transcriptional regulator [candidate division KSB1 bacterium]NIT70674.1 Lrp/AsnC family transcriptional regulator [candidate division KSB1 bacterium]NIU24403.1 Lrp/AsnC family transcriptional regulator [candidate division KSB1 bacterium]
IIEILARDARTPHAQIAEEIGLSRPAVTERVKKLENNGIIKGYSAILNPNSLGQAITAFISAKHPGVLTAEVQKALKELEDNSEVLEIHSIAGEDCFLIKVRTKDMTSLNRIINELKKPPLTMATKTTIVLESYFEKIGGTVLK